MFAWLKRNAAPDIAQVEISDIVETILVVAFPYLERKDSRVQWTKAEICGVPGLVQTVSEDDAHFQALKEGDFTSSEIHNEYFFRAGGYATDVLEGTLALPNLSPKRYSFQFGNSCQDLLFKRPGSWCLHIKDGEKVFYAPAPDEAVRQMLFNLEESSFGSWKKREQAVRQVTKNIEDYFFEKGCSAGSQSIVRRMSDLKEQAYQDATERYSLELVAALREVVRSYPGWEPRKPLHPKLYTYDVVNDRPVLKL